MRREPKIATVSALVDRSSEDSSSGAVRSVQTAELTLPQAELRALWTPMNLERLARTYWRFLTRVTLGLVRVLYSESERSVVLLARPLKLLSFDTPEYELDGDHGVVRWRIKRGLLVARRGREGHGHLRIEVRRLPATDAAHSGRHVGAQQTTDVRESAEEHEDDRRQARVRVEVEVANFHPAIASGFGRRVYNITQAKIHLFVTNGFLRSLARLDLAESRVGALDPPERR